MICECCSSEHNGNYASGRFCCIKCAHSFSTKNKRQLINEKVSQKLRFERICKICNEKFHKDASEKCHSTTRCANCRLVAAKYRSWEECGLDTKKRRLLRERGHKCEVCKNDTWLNQKIVIEMHHINGNGKDNRKENLQLLCCNCHSLTPNFGWKKMHSKMLL